MKRSPVSAIIIVLIAVLITIGVGVSTYRALQAAFAALGDPTPDPNPTPNPTPDPTPDDPDKHYITFWVDGEIYAQVELNAHFVMPENPQKEGYVFDWWYYDEGYWTEAFNYDTLPQDRDFYVYAHFEEYKENPDPTPEDPAELIFEPNDSATYKVVGITDGDMRRVVIPDTYQHKKVVAIGANAFRNQTEIEEVVIGANIITIEGQAFEGCTALHTIEWSTSLKEIKANAFRGCTALVALVVPDGVTLIGDSAFADCTDITSLNLPTTIVSIADNAFQGCTGLLYVEASPISLYSFPHTTVRILTVKGSGGINSNTSFAGCTALEKVYIEGEVDYIGSGVFAGCTSLNTVSLGRVTLIESLAFNGCTALTSIELPDTLEEIGDRAFYGCDGLTRIVIGSGVTKMGTRVFESCDNLSTIYCHAGSKPSGWAINWKEGCNARVEWGYRG